jgi:hypothetical protein
MTVPTDSLRNRNQSPGNGHWNDWNDCSSHGASRKGGAMAE